MPRRTLKLPHLAFFEGNRLADLEPLVGIIGKISIFVLEER